MQFLRPVLDYVHQLIHGSSRVHFLSTVEDPWWRMPWIKIEFKLWTIHLSMEYFFFKFFVSHLFVYVTHRFSTLLSFDSWDFIDGCYLFKRSVLCVCVCGIVAEEKWFGHFRRSANILCWGRNSNRYLFYILRSMCWIMPSQCTMEWKITGSMY